MLIAAFIVTLVALVCLFLSARGDRLPLWIPVLLIAIALLIVTSPVRAQNTVIPKALTCTTTTPTVTGTSSQILAANGKRKALIIQNNSASLFLYINFGAAATTAHYNLRTNGGANGTLYMHTGASNQAIHAIAGGSNNEVVVVSCE